MHFANLTAPRTRVRIAILAFFVTLALFVAPWVSSPATAAVGYTVSGSTTSASGVQAAEFIELYNADTGESYEATLTANNYTVEGLAPGSYSLYALSKNTMNPPYEEDVVISDRNVTHNIEFTLLSVVKGSITDVNNPGSPEGRGVLITAEPVGGGKNWQTAVYPTDADPISYELRVAPGTYKIGFTSSAYSTTQYFPQVEELGAADVLTLEPGETVQYVNAAFPLVAGPVVRLGGTNRYETSVKITQQFAPGVERLYVATGAGFADGLSAVPAAARFDSPLLLTETNSLPSATAAEVRRLKPDQIVVVGGTGVVSAKVLNQLGAVSSVDQPVFRLEGSDRYATSRAIARDAFSSGADIAFIATGANFPDALAASPAAAHLDGPVILVNGNSNSLDSATRALLVELGVTKVKIAGGSGVVNESLKQDLAGVLGVTEVIRYSGGGRESTAVAINQLFPSSNTSFLATSTGFADSLGGAALAGFKNSPLYLSPAACVPKEVVSDISRLGSSNRVILGGEGVLSTKVFNLVSC
jgi:putative cell wall-binding protein